jgi:hypothetical protein
VTQVTDTVRNGVNTVGAAGAVYASLVTYIIPVAGLALSWIVLGESIGPATIIGAAIIVTGVALAMYGPSIRIQATLSRPPAPEPIATEPLAS